MSFLEDKIKEIIKYCKSNSPLPLNKIWRPILGVVFIKKMKPEIILEGEGLNEKLNKAAVELEEELPRFKDVLFKQYELVPKDVLYMVGEILKNEATHEGDLVGDLYNMLLEQFDSHTQGFLGTHYTPKSLTNMIAAILEPSKGFVVDPAAGSGGMFLGIKDWAHKNKRDLGALQFYGTEIDSDSTNLGNINLIMNNMTGGILNANTHYKKNPLNLVGKCDYVVANPPFNQTDVKVKECLEAWGGEGAYEEYMENRKREKNKNKIKKDE